MKEKIRYQLYGNIENTDCVCGVPTFPEEETLKKIEGLISLAVEQSKKEVLDMVGREISEMKEFCNCERYDHSSHYSESKCPSIKATERNLTLDSLKQKLLQTNKE